MDSVIREANNIITQRLIHRYLSDHAGVWTVSDACITGRQFTRYGIPADAMAMRYVFEHPDQGWSFTARAVWRQGELMAPLATHCVITEYFGDGDELNVPHIVNDWLQSLPL